jgi:hypothetical protein
MATLLTTGMVVKYKTCFLVCNLILEIQKIVIFPCFV